MHQKDFTITAFSTALFSTWFFIEDLGLLFDAGDGLTSGLLQKSRKIKQVFISHADRDHLTGLLQFNQLNAREGLPIVHYPESCGSFPALKQFSTAFDPHVSGTIWKGIKAEQEFHINGNWYIRTIKNGHVEAPETQTKSLSFMLIEAKQKLKEDFKSLSGEEIKSIVAEKGRDFITDRQVRNVLGYSGDTPVEDYARWDHTSILIHEATFLKEESNMRLHGNKHSMLEDVIKMVSEIEIGKLILSHFSSRYSQEEIDSAIRQLCSKYRLEIPVYRILPGQLSTNILASDPVNA